MRRSRHRGPLSRFKSQCPTSALKGHNSNAPVDVTAERIEVQDRADRAMFAGNVHVSQGEMTLDTPRLTVALIDAGRSGRAPQPPDQSTDAAGGVVVHDPSETAKGDLESTTLISKLINA